MLAYNWVEGKNGYDFTYSEKTIEPKVQEWVIQQAIDNVISLGNSISTEYYLELQQHVQSSLLQARYILAFLNLMKNLSLVYHTKRSQKYWTLHQGFFQEYILIEIQVI